MPLTGEQFARQVAKGDKANFFENFGVNFFQLLDETAQSEDYKGRQIRVASESHPIQHFDIAIAILVVVV